MDKYCTDISDQQAAIEANIHDNIRRLHEVLEVRRTELIGQLHETIQRKLKSLAVQKDKIETIQAQLSSCLDFTREPEDEQSRRGTDDEDEHCEPSEGTDHTFPTS